MSLQSVTCAQCGTAFSSSRAGRPATYCSSSCRAKAYAARKKIEAIGALPVRRGDGMSGKATGAAPQQPDRERGEIEQITYDELVAVDRVETSLGAKALWLARSMDVSYDTGSARASLARQHTEVMDRATRTAAGAEGDELSGIEDELAALRESKGA